MHPWEKSDGETVHLLGVCGVGMAGVAYLLARRGWQVSGCDAHPNALAGWLRAAGVAVADGHAPEHVTPRTSRVIVTPAVAADDPEAAKARALGIPVSRRGEVLASLMSNGGGVAVCGTHGKTTTSCFTAHLLHDLGLDPDWCIGGFTRRLGAVAGVGAGKVLVAEADESDGTLALYHPDITVLTNLDWDHAEHFRDEGELVDCFRAAVRQTRVGVAVCHDHPRARQVAAEAAAVPVLTFGFGEGADVRATADGVWYRETNWGQVALGVSGRHNVLNALGAATAALLMGVPPERVFAALPAACGELPGRRFETVCEAGGVRFVADYAHHPQELRAAIGMARDEVGGGRLSVVFQPHRYSRTLALGADFPAAFDGADEVILLPVYAASESPQNFPGGETCDLYAHFRRQPSGPDVSLARSLEEVWGYLRRTLRAGDFVLIAGAGDIIGLADIVRAEQLHFRAETQSRRETQEVSFAPLRLCERPPEPCRSNAPSCASASLREIPDIHVTPDGALAAWSFYGVGGTARWRVEAPDEAAMAAVLKTCADGGIPWRLFGAGANAWVSDLGEAACAVRWGADACRGLTVEGGEVVAGCGWRGPALLEALTREGLSGLEFLEGVPGSVGGWLAMNAGAHGSEIAGRVKWVRCLEPDGTARVLTPDALGFAYRRCEGLRGRVAVSCCLTLTPSDSATIKARRLAIREKRLPLAGLRTTGSVFRNPPSDAAGRLLDAAGCKGLRVGGAYVTDFHANIIAVDATAQASDVLALVQQMRARVLRTSGISLETEVAFE